MEIVNLGEFTTKIYISYDEMKRFGVTCESLQTDELSTRLFFSMLYNTFGQKISSDVFVEIFDLGYDGCVIYLSQKKRKKSTFYLTLETQNPSKLFEFAKKLKGNCNNLKSCLYVNKQTPDFFRLTVESPQKLPEDFFAKAKESHLKLSFDRVLLSVTSEHSENWTLILKNNALKYLSEVT